MENSIKNKLKAMETFGEKYSDSIKEVFKCLQEDYSGRIMTIDALECDDYEINKALLGKIQELVEITEAVEKNWCDFVINNLPLAVSVKNDSLKVLTKAKALEYRYHLLNHVDEDGK